MNLLKFKYEKQTKIWGSEDWIISAHENGMSYIANTQYKGMSLKDFFTNHKNLLGLDQSATEFPLLIKIIDAKDDLSIQVHPDNKYAKKNENALGKTECWYILSENKSDIIVGQKAKNKEELKKAIEEDSIMDKLDILDIKKEDFFYIPAGCVHAIRKNTRLLEIQQSSDITYRLYDYKRPGVDGNLRELHVDKSLDVIDYNFKNTDTTKVVEDNENYKKEVLVDGEFFIVHKIIIKKEYQIKDNAKYIIGINIGNVLNIASETILPEEGFMLLKNSELTITEPGEIILTTSK